MSYSSPAYALPEDRSSYDTAYEPGPSFIDRGPAQWELSVDDGIGPPPRGKGAKLLRRGVVLAILASGAWAWANDRWPSLPPWLAAEMSSLTSSVEQSIRAALARQLTPTPVQETAATEPLDKVMDRPAGAAASDPMPALGVAPPLPPAPLPPAAPAPVKPEAAAVMQPQAAPPQVMTTGSISAAPGKTATAAVEQPYSVATPPKADPLQMRAKTAGLHPDISRALLERLSALDYRNAAAAVRTALARTPENGVLVWPRQRGPGEAIFEVRFVSGAAPDCRRYVVTVLKDRWVTTAPPMERCGITRRAARS